MSSDEMQLLMPTLKNKTEWKLHQPSDQNLVKFI